jgi:signal transduction histidine kinase
MELPTPLAGATILLVDDNPANLGVLTHALTAHGCRVLVAQHGGSGIQIAKRAQPELILLDVQLPGMDGFEICRRLKADVDTRAIPVLFMTAHGAAADKLSGFAAGGVDYITKPVEEAEVLARVTAHVRIGQLARRLQEQNIQLQAAQAALRRANEDLERRVAERTAELAQANAILQAQIGERKRLEAQFLQAQKMEGIGRLAGGVAHDFNNLLTAITGYAGLARDTLTPTDPLHDDLEAILEAANRAAALTRQLLIFARRQVLEPRVLNLNDLVLNVDKLLRRLIGEDIELVTLPTPDLWLVKADANQIEQMVVNLAVNARDAMPDGGTLTIETANVVLGETYARQHVGVTPGPCVRLAVSDTGVGMTPEVQAQIFDPFFTTKEAGKGTGLGLATCYGIIKQHGGHIWVYSEVGHGTTFKVYLPRGMEAADIRLIEQAPEAELRGNETVLLVEDEGAVRQLAARVLRQLGYTVLEAGDGADALRVADKHCGAIDLLLADVVLPQLRGTALAECLQERLPDLKVLFMSGYTDQTIVHHNILEPDVAFLQKPFSPELLARKVREVLAQRRC